MTRYARARGSKASNERLPERATPWSAMKQQMEKQNLPDTKHIVVTSSNTSDSEYLNRREVVNDDVKLWEEFDGCSAASNLSDKVISENSKNANSIKIKKQKLNKLDKSSIHNKSNRYVKTKGNTFIINSTHSDTEVEADNTNNKKNMTPTVEIKTSKKKRVKRVSESKMETNFMTQSEPIDDAKFNQERKDSIENSAKKFKNETEEEKLHKLQETDILSNTINTEFSNYKIERSNNQSKARYNNENNQNRPKKGGLKTQCMFINGKKVEISNFQGFPVRKEDAERLYNLRKDLRSKSVPRPKIESILQTERRKAEKSLARERKVVCFKCRKYGHNMAECSELGDASGICFKCGSTEHSVTECRVVRGDSFKFAHCFICQEPGHIARQCPDNPRGLYPKGGACNECGDVTHLKKDCPNLVAEKEKCSLTVGMVHNNSIEGLDEDFVKSNKRNALKKTGVVKF